MTKITYQFVVYSDAGPLFSGELSMPADVHVDEVTKKVAHEAARMACLVDVPWDPFNLRVTLRPQSTPCNP